MSEPCPHCADRDRQRARLGARVRALELEVARLKRGAACPDCGHTPADDRHDCMDVVMGQAPPEGGA